VMLALLAIACLLGLLRFAAQSGKSEETDWYS